VAVGCTMRYHFGFRLFRWRGPIVLIVLLTGIYFVTRPNPQDQEVRRWLARAEMRLQLGDARGVYDSFEGALRASGGSPRTYLDVAELWSRYGGFRQSLRAAEEAVEAARRLHDREVQYWALRLIADIYRRADRFPAAAEALERALKVRPKDAGVMNDLAYYYAEANTRLARAEPLAREAVRAEPWNASFVDTLGWVYFKAGRYEEAQRELRLAVHLTPDQAVLRRHLGAVLLELGDRRAAGIEFKKAGILERWWLY